MNNKAIIALLTSLGVIIFSTLLLIRKDVRPSTIKQANNIPYEVQSVTAQGLLSSGKYLFANKIFENSYVHFQENPAFINSYSDSLMASDQVAKASHIIQKSLLTHPLDKKLRLKLTQCFILQGRSSDAYKLLTELPLFTQKEADFLSLIIMTTPNKSALSSLMGKMRNFTDHQKFFTEDLLSHSPNSNFINKHLVE